MVIFFFPLAGSFFSFSWVNDFDFCYFFSAIVWTKWGISTKTSLYSFISHFFFIWQFWTKDFWPNSGHDFLVHYFDIWLSFDHIGRYFDLNFLSVREILEKYQTLLTWAIIRVAGWYVHGHRGEGRGVTGGLIFDFLLWCNINFAMKN